MKEKRDCKIVQDLLPNYIEKLTNEETNKFIEEHLKNCNECSNILNNMKEGLEANKNIEINSKKVNYFKKYSRKLQAFEISTIILLVLAVGTFVYYTFYWRAAYLNTAQALVDTMSEGIYPDTFYATIEEISDSELYNIKTIKVKGLEINDINHREEYYFDVFLDNIGDNFKIKWNGNTISFDELKVGQTVAIYNYGNTTETNFLESVRMIVVIDDNI